MEHDDMHLSMMDQWPWIQQTNCRLPKRFQDKVPQPPPPLSEVHVTGVATHPPSETTQDTRLRSLTQQVSHLQRTCLGSFVGTSQQAAQHTIQTTISQWTIYPTWPWYMSLQHHPTSTHTPIEVHLSLEIGFGMVESTNLRPALTVSWT